MAGNKHDMKERKAHRREDDAPWGNPPENTSQRKAAGQARWRTVLSNAVTLVVSAAIIYGGFMTPTLLAPFMDPYRNETVLLSEAEGDSLAQHVFRQPVVLYPWDDYAEENCRPLSPTERDLLVRNNVPGFLEQVYRDNVWVEPASPEEGAEGGALEATGGTDDTTGAGVGGGADPGTGTGPGGKADAGTEAGAGAEAEAGTGADGAVASSETEDAGIEQPDYDFGDIAGAFEYLQPERDTEQGCFVLVDENWGPGDDWSLRCAVDLQGNIIALSYLDNAPQPDSDTTGDGTSALDDPDRAPASDERLLWSFVHTTTLEAQTSTQTELESAFATLDNDFAYRFGTQFEDDAPDDTGTAQGDGTIPGNDTDSTGGTTDSPGTNGTDEGTEGVTEEEGANASEPPVTVAPPIPLYPRIFTTEDSLLYIYDLDSGVRLIIYRDPETQVCFGFNLQR